MRDMSPAGILSRTLRKGVDLEPGEGRALFWSFSYFFVLLCSYYLIRPLRDEMGIRGGVENLHWLFSGTFVAMLAAVPLFGWLTSRFPRRRFLPVVYLFFIASLLLFYLLFEMPAGKTGVARAFFIWTSVFNLFVVSVFWSFMTDLYSDAQARRLFGFIAAGGTAGAIAGPVMGVSLAVALGPTQLLLASAALLGLALLCIQGLLRWQAAQGDPQVRTNRPGAGRDRPLGGTVLAGIRLVASSPYLLGIAGLMLLFTTASTFLYFQQAHIIRDSFDDSGTRTAMFAGIDLAVNSLTILIQILITGRLVRYLGLAGALALIPLLLCFGFLALALAPIWAVLVVVQGIRRAGNYAISRPAREMLYVVLDREQKYKAKNFNDTVVYRGGDAGAAWLYAALREVGLSLSQLALLAIPVSALWAWLAFRLGQQQSKLATKQGRES